MLHVARCTLFHCVKERKNYDKNVALNCLWNYRKGTADITIPHCSGGRCDTRLRNTALHYENAGRARLLFGATASILLAVQYRLSN